MFASNKKSHFWGRFFILLSAVFTLVLASLPSGMVIESPGPVLRLIGFEDEDIIKMADRHDVSGKMIALSVYLTGSPDAPIPVAQSLLALIDRRVNMVAMEKIYPSGISSEEYSRAAKVSMKKSQETAIAVALRKLGKQIKQKLVVDSVLENYPAAEKLFPGDEIFAINGYPVTTITDFISRIVPGSLTLAVRREGRDLLVEVHPVLKEGRNVIGINLGEDFDFTLPVEFSAEDVGGASAGMMFSLAVYELLSGENLTGGSYIAGTGTINSEGTVGVIGGVVPKMWSAYEAKAEMMLLPKQNCHELAFQIPRDFLVYSVENFEQALDTIRHFKAGERNMANRCQ